MVQQHTSRPVAKTACLIVVLAVIAGLFARTSAPSLILEVFSHLPFLMLLAASYAVGWALYFWFGKVALREKLVRCAAMSASLFVSLSLVESTAVFGLVDYTRILPGGGRIPVGYSSLSPKWWRLDPELIHVRHPHQQIRGETSGDIRSVPESEKRVYPIEVTYDATGFRNSSDLAHAPLVLIGDSFVEAGLVPEHQTTAAILRRELATAVANLGITMYGPQQELAVLRRYGLTLDPRVVLWFFFEGNDLEDTVRYESHRLEVESRFEHRSTWYRRYLDRSFVANANHVVENWIRLQPAQTPQQFARSCEVVAAGKQHRLYFRYGGRPLGPENSEGLDHAKRIIETAHDLAAASGARFGLVYVPTKFRVYQNHCGDERYEASPPDGKLDHLPKEFLAWGREQGISVLDLTPVLQARARTDGLLYFTDDSHWTPLGNQRVADTVIEFLKERNWIDGSDQ